MLERLPDVELFWFASHGDSWHPQTIESTNARMTNNLYRQSVVEDIQSLLWLCCFVRLNDVSTYVADNSRYESSLRSFLKKNGPTPASFSLTYGLFKLDNKFRNHDLSNNSSHPKPIDQGSRFDLTCANGTVNSRRLLVGI